MTRHSLQFAKGGHRLCESWFAGMVNCEGVGRRFDYDIRILLDYAS